MQYIAEKPHTEITVNLSISEYRLRKMIPTFITSGDINFTHLVKISSFNVSMKMRNEAFLLLLKTCH